MAELVEELGEGREVPDAWKPGLRPQALWIRIVEVVADAQKLVGEAERQVGDLYLELVRAFVGTCAAPEANPWSRYLAADPATLPPLAGDRSIFLQVFDRPERWRGRKPTDRQLACLWVLSEGDFALAKGPSGFFTVAKVLDAEARAFREARRRAARPGPDR